MRLSLLLLMACSGRVVEGDDLTPHGDGDDDPTEHVYDPDHLLAVDIDIDPDDWDELRYQTREEGILDGEDCQAEPFGSPFTYFPATVTIDGEAFPNVGVRKKGFLGSLSDDKPALKVDLSEYGETALFSGVERLTLNNSVSDPSYVRQCLAYSVYRDAGMPASRCNFATVTVNGDDLGLFVNLEPIKKPLLRRYFDDDEGNLYEGTLSDFREGWTGTFEKKTNEGADDYSDIEAMVEALQAPDDELIDQLDPTLDIDAFLTHWAAEVLTVHVDGYAWNTNNYYLYNDPDTGRFHFLPWGNDECLMSSGGDMPDTVFAYGQLANRLYGHPDMQAQYLDRLAELLDQAWDEEVLSTRIDQMEEIVLSVEGDGEVTDAIAEVREVVSRRRDDIVAELDDGPVEWEYEQRDNYCFVWLGELEAAFETTWGSQSTEDIWSYGDADLWLVMDDESWEIDNLGAVAGDGEGEPILFMVGWMSETEAVLVYMTADEGLWTPGDFWLDWDQAIAALFYIDTATMDDFEMLAYVIGQASFEEAGTDEGDPIRGALSGDLLSWGF